MTPDKFKLISEFIYFSVQFLNPFGAQFFQKERKKERNVPMTELFSKVND